MRTSVRWRIVLILVSVPVLCLAGCSNARLKSKQADRQQQMKEYLEWYASYDTRAPEQLQRLKRLGEAQRAGHQKELEEALKRVDEAFERDSKRWKEGQAQRESWLKAMKEGRPGEIQKTWREMM